MDRRLNVMRCVYRIVAGVALVGLAACNTQPKYPIYMTEAPAPIPTAEPPVDAAPVIDSAPQGTVEATDLPPPPPPPPPPADTSSLKPAAPAPVMATSSSFVYVVVGQDTVFGISRRFGVPVRDIYALNGLDQNSTLKIGQKIVLPASAVDKGAEARANGSGLTSVATAAASSIRPAPVVAAPAPVAATPKPVSTPPAATPRPVVTTPAPVAAPAPAPVQAAPKPATPAGFPTNARLTEMGKGRFVWPVKGKIIVPYGQLAPSIHNDGINIQAAAGTEIRAASDGVVVYQGDQVRDMGKTIYIKHEDGWYTGYSHLQQIAVKNNQAVRKGEVIGTVGQTGVIDKPQLHFEIRYTPSTDMARPINPGLVLPAQ